MFTNMLDLLYHIYYSTVYNYKIYYVRTDVICFNMCSLELPCSEAQLICPVVPAGVNPFSVGVTVSATGP